jgi:hypothetical protein
MSSENYTDERRQYYRIDDSAIFSYRKLDDGILENHKQSSNTFEIVEIFSQINRQMSTSLGRICEHSADVASYLKGMDKKIELLVQMYLFNDDPLNNSSHRQLNIGAGGLAFGTDEKLEQDTLIAMDLILSTDLLCLHLTGNVIHISDNDSRDFAYRASVSFTNISDIEADQIMKHIMRIQAERLRLEKNL